MNSGSESTTVAEAVLRCLEAEGVEHIFGVPGGALTPLFECLLDHPNMRHVLAKHEGGASFMANGYARVRRRLGVCFATTGPGGTNALTGIASSFSDSVPVLLITGQTATRAFGRGSLQDSSGLGIDLVEIYKPVTKLSAMLANPERMPDLMRRALRTAFSGRPGPVHLSIPVDMMKQEISWTPVAPARYRPACAPVDRNATAAAARALLEAERPCIVVGHGANLAGAAAALVAIAEKLHIPVATTPMAKSIFPENHPLSLGVYGFAGHARAETYLLGDYVDVLVVIGSSLGELVTNAWDKNLQPTKQLIQIDIDPCELGKNYPVDLGIIGDARVVLEEIGTQVDALLLTPEFSRGLRARSDDPLEAFREEVPRYSVRPPMSMRSASVAMMKPQQVIREMQAAMPDDALLFIDSGNCVSWSIHYFESRKPDTYFVNMGLASMGHATAGVVGGKLAAPTKTVVALVGDAAFAMNGMEVHTAVEHSAAIVWIVLNNSGHGMVYHGEKMLLGRHLNACHFSVPLDIAGMARSMGARGFKVETPIELRAALQEAIASGVPCVIDAKIDPEEIPHSLARRARTVGAAQDNQALSVRVPLIKK
ncbi:MAG: thiamine pyrophosphate-binding protein [Byssovorax sp.]